jgi:thiol:disulfide interchange protein
MRKLINNVYVKNISLEDADTNFIDADMFANYPYDNKFVKDSAIKINNSELQKQQQQYKKGNLMASQQANEMHKTYPHIPSYIHETRNMYNALNTKTNEYKDVLKTIKQEKKKYRGTYEQQKVDLNVLQETNKMNALLWGLSSIAVISLVVMLKNRQ